MFDEKAAYSDDRHTVTSKTTIMQKYLSEQEELISALNQKLTIALRPYQEEKPDSAVPRLADVSRQSPLLDELDLLAARLSKHNVMLTDLLHRLDT